jgi:hypothetical protein
MKRLLCTIIVLFTGALAADRALYVQSPAARLLTEPRMDAPGAPLAKGVQVTQIGEQGMFYRIRASSGTGYVPKVFASAFAPGEKANLGAIERSSAMKARSRASNYSQTAAARGLSESQRMRVRGSMSDFDFDSILWLENVDISAQRFAAFESGAP